MPVKQTEKQIEIDPKWILGIGGAAALEKGYVLPVRRTPDGCLVIPVKFNRREKRVLRRKKQILPSVWAERYRYLPETARFKGLWRNDNAAYLAGIMDASFFKSVEEIIVVAVSQSGKTESVYTCLGYAADRRPGNAMIAFPVEQDAKDNAKDRLAPMFRDSPRLREYLTGYMDDMGAIKMTLQHMIIYMAWSNSPSRLANRPVMYGYADEEEKFGETAGKKEASPVDLLKKRMRTFKGVRKLWRTSSPSIESGSIWVALTNDAQVVFDYFVKCPACGRFQKMEFGDSSTRHGVKWTEGVTDAGAIEATRDAWYACAHCDAKWDDMKRNAAVRAGEWRDRAHGLSLFTALNSAKPLRIGFHLPAWVSPFVDIWECAASWLKGQKAWTERRDPQPMKDFYNGFAAEPWKDLTVSSVTESALLRYKSELPRNLVPPDTAILGLLVDTQQSSFYYQLWAFGYAPEIRMHMVRHGHVQTFTDIEGLLATDHPDHAGRNYRIAAGLIDSGGTRHGYQKHSRTVEVYEWCSKNRIMSPIKGLPGRAGEMISYKTISTFPGSNRPIPGGLTRINIRVDIFKDELERLLSMEPDDPGALSFHGGIDEFFAKHYTSEAKNEKGEWIHDRARGRNDYFDCNNYAVAMREIWKLRIPKKAAAEIGAASNPNGVKANGMNKPNWFSNRR